MGASFILNEMCPRTSVNRYNFMDLSYLISPSKPVWRDSKDRNGRTDRRDIHPVHAHDARWRINAVIASSVQCTSV
jgi:hypothetical protein